MELEHGKLTQTAHFHITRYLITECEHWKLLIYHIKDQVSQGSLSLYLFSTLCLGKRV